MNYIQPYFFTFYIDYFSKSIFVINLDLILLNQDKKGGIYQKSFLFEF